MTRVTVRFLVGVLGLAALAGCRGLVVEERDPWRHEAEAECLKSGAVREGPSIILERPIQGPGVCGADFPLKVSALGAAQTLGFADDPRPPGTIPQYSPVEASRPPTPHYVVPQSPGTPYPAVEPGAPLSIKPPGIEPPADDNQGSDMTSAPVYRPGAIGQAPSTGAWGPVYRPGAISQTPSTGSWAPVEQVPLAPSRGPALAAAGPVAVTPVATLACPVVSMLDRWISEGVQPAALKWFNQPVLEIKQISAYSCRSMNGQRGMPISEHAFGNALDVAAFTLADGRRVTVKDGWHGPPEERGFLHDVQLAACQRFATVLAPGSNAFHYDHIHVDLARHRSGRSICNPKPVPGDLVAGRPGDPFTGTIGAQRTSRAPAHGGDERFDRGLPHAVAGED
jgi:Extensin-like protein C-terminus